MSTDEELQVAFEADTLEAAVREVMRLAAERGQEVITIMGTGQARDLTNADEVRDYLVKTSQAAYTASGRATAGAIRKVVYRTVGVVFEPILRDELEQLIFSRTSSPPIHVAQFWQRLG